METVSRDGSQEYRRIIDSALPTAKHVSDRFHLVKNLIEAAQSYFNRIIPFCITPKPPKSNILGIVGRMKAIERGLIETYNNKLKLFKQIKALQKKGKRASVVARETGVPDGRVRKYFMLETLPLHGGVMAERASKLNAYKQQILDMIQDGMRGVEIIAVLRQADCKSADSRIRDYIRRIRRDGVDYTKAKLYRRDVCRLLYSPPEKIRDEILRGKIEAYVSANPGVKWIIDIINEFRELLKSGEPNRLDDWNARIKAQNIKELSGYARYLESDLSAIKNAIIYPYSNGIAEGKINKLKTVKRMVYGRASYEILTSRLFLSDQFG